MIAQTVPPFTNTLLPQHHDSNLKRIQVFVGYDFDETLQNNDFIDSKEPAVASKVPASFPRAAVVHGCVVAMSQLCLPTSPFPSCKILYHRAEWACSTVAAGYLHRGYRVCLPWATGYCYEARC